MPAYCLADYLRDLRAIRNTGSATSETSFYPPLSNLLNAAGDSLKPKVLFSTQLRDDGAGQPDGGLFPQSRSQARRAPGTPPTPQLPERGAVEIKPATVSLDELARSSQTRRYLLRYNLVLITNYREFRLLRLDGDTPVTVEQYTLFRSAEDLFHATPDAKHPQLLPDFLRRVMLYQVPLTDPKDVAWFLASYAREARARAEDHDLPFFRNVKSSLEESLGITFEGEKGDHFFRSTLVQTLFYGIFSAWVLWRRSTQAVHHGPAHPLTPFNWRLADDFLHVPILRKLFREISDRRTLDSIHIAEILDLAGGVLNRVQPSLFDVFRFDEAVAYFYEPFLEAFDPELRKELGVWYTPREIVHYMVERVDHLLRTELAQPLGLASPAVRILDPCCGTGAYLTAVLQRIHRTLKEQAGDDDWQVPDKLRTAALTRVFGFEIMPAPFVISHMELARLLEEAGAPLSDDQRAQVFLTNALTGWEPVRHPQSVMYEEMEQEREAAEAVKQTGTILVILGNPPYNGYAGIAQIDEERGLTSFYRAPVSGIPAPQGQGLNDLYIRFFRIAERRIAQNPEGQGIVSFISNNAWLDGLSHTSMRAHFLHTFQQLYIDNLNGDKYRTGKQTPEGKPDPSAFSTRTNREGIQVGTAIATLVRTNALIPIHNSGCPTLAELGWDPATTAEHTNDTPAVALAPEIGPGFSPDIPGSPASRASAPGTRSASSIHLRDLWGAAKLSHLERESRRELDPAYHQLTPHPALGLPFAQRTVSADYTSWPRLPELFPISFPGVQTGRDEAPVEIDRNVLTERMDNYLDPEVSNDEVRQESPALMRNTARFNPAETRAELLRVEENGRRQVSEMGHSISCTDLRKQLIEQRVRPYYYRPFDLRWLYWEMHTKLLDEKRDEYVRSVGIGTLCFAAAQSNRKSYDPPLVFSSLGGRHLVERGANIFPVEARLPTLFHSNVLHQNLAEPLGEAASGMTEVEPFFFHALAIMHTPAYRRDNAGALLGDWPRIPLPATAPLLEHSAQLGRRLANLLDPESQIKNTPDLSPEFSFLAALQLPKPAAGKSHDLTQLLRLTAGWGARGQGSTVMPGKGRHAERPWTAAERAKLQTLAAAQSLTLEQTEALLGATCFDIYLNKPEGDEPSVFWTAVPANVWTYTLGGYQVLKKWLSYRELPLLNRPLKPDEAAWFSEVVRRIAAILLLGPALDASYAAILPTATGLPDSSARR